MRSFTLSISLSFTAFLFGKEQIKPMSQADYVALWSNVAVEHMQDYRIPASITLAQGILESGNGNSPLATQANNHFGIKCHEWTGDKIYFDDDQKNECFRKYASADESYKDHSLFLTTKQRYKSLFQLPVDDYKSWANGLKTAGYATSSTYATKLIDLIERLKLYEYDEKTPANLGKELLAKEIESSKPSAKNTIDAEAGIYKTHTVKTHHNDLKYVVARKGDTFNKISKELNVAMWQLYKYNDYGPKKDLLEEGDIVYIEPKRMKSKDKNATFITKKEMTIREVSQIEGIKVNALMKLNALTSEESIVPKGQKVLLR